MKNLLTKILFISLLLSAVIPSGVQAKFTNITENLEKIGVTVQDEKIADAEKRDAVIEAVDKAEKTVFAAIEIAERSIGYKKEFIAMTLEVILQGALTRETVLAVHKAVEIGGAVEREKADKANQMIVASAREMLALAVKIKEIPTKEEAEQKAVERAILKTLDVAVKKALRERGVARKSVKLAEQKAAELAHKKTLKVADEALTAVEKLYKKTQGRNI